MANSNAKFDLANYISTYTLTLFGIFVGILAALATLGGFLIKNLIQESVLNSATKRVNEMIELQIQIQKILTVAYVHGRLAFSMYTHFSSDLKYLLDYTPSATPAAILENKIELIRRDAVMAKGFAQNGLSILRQIESTLANEDRWRILNADLSNHHLYNYAVELLCLQKLGIPFDRTTVFKLLDFAYICVALADTPTIKQQKLWIEMYDSAAFAMVSFGDEQIRGKGIDLIRQICNGTDESRFAPSQERIAEFRNEYAL